MKKIIPYTEKDVNIQILENVINSIAPTKTLIIMGNERGNNREKLDIMLNYTKQLLIAVPRTYRVKTSEGITIPQIFSISNNLEPNKLKKIEYKIDIYPSSVLESSYRPNPGDLKEITKNAEYELGLYLSTSISEEHQFPDKFEALFEVSKANTFAVLQNPQAESFLRRGPDNHKYDLRDALVRLEEQ